MQSSISTLKLALPKGRMQEGVFALLSEAGIRLSVPSRGYRPRISLPETETKILKPQNIVEMLASGSRDVGLAGADWVCELGLDLVEVLDTGLDPVRLVAAVPAAMIERGGLPDRPLRFASEYVRLTTRWCERRGRGDRVVRSYGATEVFPPEDADGITDVTATGSTLEANGLVIVDELITSSTRLYASPRAWADHALRTRIEDLAMILQSVLEARRRVMLELNCPADRLDSICRELPCMREPTIAPLHAASGYAVKAAVKRDALPRLIPRLKQAGGVDIVISPLSQVVP